MENLKPNRPNPEHEKFGGTISGSRWFKGEPKITTKRMYPVQARWLCPIEGCDGEMKYAGWTWPVNPPGYHHTCHVCGFTAAIHGKKYPCTEYVEDPE
jgi:hypothetical protein